VDIPQPAGLTACQDTEPQPQPQPASLTAGQNTEQPAVGTSGAFARTQNHNHKHSQQA